MDLKGLNTQELIKLSKQITAQSKIQMSIMNNTLNDLIKELPNEEAAEIERLKGLTQKAIALAKQGKGTEAQDLIRNYKHGSKSNK